MTALDAFESEKQKCEEVETDDSSAEAKDWDSAVRVACVE